MDNDNDNYNIVILDNTNQMKKQKYIHFINNNSILIFNTKDDILLLIYGGEKSIISYNIKDDKEIIELKNAHNINIYNFYHYYDKMNKIDYLISSSRDLNIKLWNIENYECLLDLRDIYDHDLLKSSCILNNNNKNYILTCSARINNPILVFDFKGKEIEKVEESFGEAEFIDSYFDKKLNKNFIITGYKNESKSFDFDKCKLYRKYNDSSKEKISTITIFEDNEKIKFIETSYDNYIRIWDFHEGILLNKINVGHPINCVCLWDDKTLYFNGDSNELKYFDYKNFKIYEIPIKFENKIVCIKKIKEHPKYGDCLILKEFDIFKYLFKNKS